MSSVVAMWPDWCSACGCWSRKLAQLQGGRSIEGMLSHCLKL